MYICSTISRTLAPISGSLSNYRKAKTAVFSKETYSKRDKKILINRLKRGGKDGIAAMEKIYKNYDYQAYLNMYSSEKGVATVGYDDMLHDAMLIFRDNVRKDKFDLSSNINIYITSIAKNLIQNEKRRYKTEEIQDSNWEMYGVEESVSQYYTRKEAKANIAKLLDELKPRCQELLKLWQQDYTYDEIVEIMNFGNRQKAKRQKYNCLRKMLELLPSYPELKTFYHE